tara:strand:- start:190 stop:822 length:633 start_codon:yes stop_codon:yes gene_type:complete
MANYMKIPLAVNPPRSFKTQAMANAPTWTSAIGTLTSGTGVTGQAVVGGSGSSAVATIAIAVGATLADVTATITTAGEGYKVGDQVDFPAGGGGAGESEWTDSLSFIIAAADLITVEGSTLNSYQLIPVDNVAFVKPVSATSAELITMNWDADAGRALKWTVTVDDVPASTEPQLAADLSAAVNAASQAENSVPVVSFYNNAEAIDVDYS